MRLSAPQSPSGRSRRNLSVNNTHMSTQVTRKEIANAVQTALTGNTRLLTALEQSLAKHPHLTPERMTRTALTMVLKNPKLMGMMENQISRVSLSSSLIEAASLGLEPDGRQGHLVPFGDKITFMPGYAGLIDLATESGEIVSIIPDVVYAQDEFEDRKGSSRELIHRSAEGIEDPGPIVAAYAVAEFKNGRKQWIVIRKRDIEVAKRTSRSARDPNGAWVIHEAAMWMKTAIKRLMKYLPRHKKSAALMAAIEKDDMIDTEATAAVTSPEPPKTRKPAFDNGSEDDVPWDSAEATPTATAPVAAPVPAPAPAPEPAKRTPRAKATPPPVVVPSPAPEPEPEPATEADAEAEPENEPAPAPEPSPKAPVIQEHVSTTKLRELMAKSGVTETEVFAWADQMGQAEKGEKSFNELPWAAHNRMVSAWPNIAKSIIAARG